MAQELSQTQDPENSPCVVTLPADLDDPSLGARILRENVRERGYDVAVLLVASGQRSYTGPFLAQPAGDLDRMLALNVGATCALCRLFGEDMAARGRGRILLVGAPGGATPGVAGACAFSGSMAFVRALADGLQQELSPNVGVSFLDCRGVGRQAGLAEALRSTCVSFLAPMAEVEGEKADAGATASADTGVRRPTPALSSPLSSQAWTEAQTESWELAAQAYTRLAREQNFRVLPFGLELDQLQRSAPVEFSNAMLVGFVCTIFALQSQPGISQTTKNILGFSNDVANLLFFMDYLARWWSRGLRLDYVITPTMISDLLSVVPFLLRGVVPALQGVELNFLKLFRVLRTYRFFKPEQVRNLVRLLLGPGLATEAKADLFMKSVRPYQLQVARASGVVFTLLFVTAALVYQMEHGVNPQFENLQSALYFSIIALSTVGFGDIAPVTEGGKAVISISIIVSLCVIPFQASTVASAVAEEEELRRATQDAEALLASLEQSREQLAWDAARIAELEDLEREERSRKKILEDKKDKKDKKDMKVLRRFGWQPTLRSRSKRESRRREEQVNATPKRKTAADSAQ